MFSVLKKAYKMVPLAVVPLIMAGLLFVSCDNNPDHGSSIDATAPTISEQPQGGTFDVGETETFPLTVTASVSDGGTLSYQWYSNGSNSTTGGTAVGTSATLTLNKTDFTSNVTKYYYVVVTNTITDNGDGGRKTDSVTSDVVEVIVDGVDGVYLNAKLPVIETLSGGTWDVSEDDEFELTVEAEVDDGGTLSYQWYSTDSTTNNTSGDELDGETAETLTLDATDYETDGDYYFYVIVTNTNNDVDGNKTTSKASNVAIVTVTGNETTTPEFTIPEGLKGTWVSEWDEEFIITDTTFSSKYDGDVSYEGTIVNHRADGIDGGYITIQYTDAGYYSDGVGKFYVIHYKDLTATTVSIAGAYDEDDPEFADAGGKATQAEAEAAYTVENDCFSMYSDCTKDTGGSVNAQTPSITGQPTGTAWNVSTTASINLTVTASVSDGGTLGYQWYSNSTNSTTGGTAISTGGTSATLSLAKANYTSDTSYYFYVIVTNTNNSVTGNTSASTTSSVATVTVTGNVVIPAEIVGYFQAEFAYWPSMSEDFLGGYFIDDGFKIDATAKTFFYYMNSTLETYWGGNIVKLIDQDDDSGEPAVLIIEITSAEGDWYSPSPTVGKYFAAAYKNPTSFAVSSSTAYKFGDPSAKNTGVDTIEEAIAEYTNANGYYPSTWPLYYPHAVSVEDFVDLQGRWLFDDDPNMILDIMGTVLIQFFDEDDDGIYDFWTAEEEAFALGNIVDFVNIDSDSGILYLISSGYDNYSTNKYYAAAWKITNDGIELALSSDENATLAGIKEDYPDINTFEDEGSFFAFTKE